MESTVRESEAAVLTRLTEAGEFDGVMLMDNLKTRKVSLTAAQVKALAATPITLVPAPGADRALEYVGAVVRLVAGTEVLAEDVGGSNLQVKYTDGSGVAVSEEIEMTGFITQATDYQTRSLALKDAIVADTGAANQPLVLHNVGAGEITGNATGDAVLELFVTYRDHDLS